MIGNHMHNHWARPDGFGVWSDVAGSSPAARAILLPNGVVTLSVIGSIWTINQQAKPLKTLA